MSEFSKKYWTDDPELMEKYVLGYLSEDERKKFDSEIADCEPCKEKLRREKLMFDGIRFSGRAGMKLKLRKKLLQRRSLQIQNYGMVGLAAAVIIIAVGVGVYSIWFSDIQFPKKFSKKEIIVNTPKSEDSVKGFSSMDGPHESAGSGESEITEKQDDGKNAPALLKGSEGAGTRQPPPSSRKAEKKNLAPPAKAASTASAAVKPFSQKVWLIGTVVMLSNLRKDNSEEQSLQKYSVQHGRVSGRERGNDERNSKSFTIKISDKLQHIVIEQRALYELPSSRRTALAAKTHIETFVEHNERGLFMTLYNDKLQGADIENASVSISSGDSLIVTLPDQQIVYRLPASWNLLQPSLHR